MLQEAYEEYLNKVGLSKETIPAMQYDEMQKAFMAGCVTVLVDIETASIVDQSTVSETLRKCKNELFDYWQIKGNGYN